MNFPDLLFSPYLTGSAHGVLAVLLMLLARYAPWRYLQPGWALNLWLGATVCLMLIWSVEAGIKPGLHLHLLGATAMTLMFGPALAFGVLLCVIAGITAAGQAGWSAFSLNVLIMGGVPVLFSYLLFHWADRRLPNHFFVYIFVNAFFGAALAIALTGMVSSLILSASGVYDFGYLRQHYLPYYVFMGWSEALTTGMIMTLMVIYRPQWVRSFDDKRYLNR